MNVRSLLALGLLSLAVFAGGCGGADCTSLCEDANACEGATENTDCAGTCADALEVADGTSCRSQYDSYVSCAAGRPDICDATDTACNADATSYVNCVVKFCTDNPMDAACTN